MQPKILISFELTPLGQLNATWTIPNILFSGTNKFIIEVPGFKYDLPTFASIPVPLSSKSYETQVANIKFPKTQFQVKEKIASYGNKLLQFKIRKQLDVTENTTIRYSISNILNNDGIYFVVVYPFRSPFEDIEHHIELKAKLSYNIRLFKFWERYFSYPSNEKLIIEPVFTSEKTGDEIIVRGVYRPSLSHTLDLHLTATRFPIFIRRDKFWMTIFIIIMLIALSPYVVAIIDIF